MDRFTYVWNILFNCFYTFEVKTHFVAEESLMKTCMIGCRKIVDTSSPQFSLNILEKHLPES